MDAIAGGASDSPGSGETRADQATHLGETWPVAWKALVLLGLASWVAPSWPILADRAWAFFVAPGFLGLALLAVGLLVRRGFGWARWLGIVACFAGALVGLLATGRLLLLIDGLSADVIAGGVHALAYLAVGVLVARSPAEAAYDPSEDGLGRVLHILAWGVLVYGALMSVIVAGASLAS